MDSLGTKIGMHRLGSIRKYNNDGTVLVALNEAGLQQSKLEFKCSIPAAWSGPSGEFLGGYPKIGQSVKVIQGNGGEWTIVNYETNPNVLSDTRLFSQFKSGRLLGQVKNGNRFFLDPDSGFVAGQEIQYLQADPNRSIFSTNFLENHTFTSAGRKIEGTIKRDLVDHSSRSFINSFLESHQYNDSLFTIGMDPTSAISDVTVGSNVRNTPLIESKEIIYEFAHDYNF